MSELGWTGTLTAVIVPGMVTAFGVFWMTQYLEEALPYELVEAARVDGCSMIRTFFCGETWPATQSLSSSSSSPKVAILRGYCRLARWICCGMGV